MKRDRERGRERRCLVQESTRQGLATSSLSLLLTISPSPPILPTKQHGLSPSPPVPNSQKSHSTSANRRIFCLYFVIQTYIYNYILSLIDSLHQRAIDFPISRPFCPVQLWYFAPSPVKYSCISSHDLTYQCSNLY